MTMIRSRKEFNHELERALQHLYDPVYLRSSGLMPLLLAGARQSPTALQDVITRGIRALRPDLSVPRSARAWRLYEVLTMRYAEQLSQEDVAHALAFSARHVRRQEIAAIQMLADHLWAYYELDLAVSLVVAEQAERAAPEIDDDPRPDDDDSRRHSDRDLAQIVDAEPRATVGLTELVRGAIDVVAPLAQAGAVNISLDVPRQSAQVTGHAAALRQALIGLLTAGVALAEGGSIRVMVGQGVDEERVTVSALPAVTPDIEIGTEVADYIRVADELMRAMGGRLLVSDTDGSQLLARLCLPGTQCAPVVAIDDNADALRLYERYLYDTRFRAITSTDPERGLELAVDLGASAIILDIMIPDVDGWELLGRLRNHPSLANVPLIVCSILPHERLATTLGASRFLRKPVTRDQLLSALEELVQERPT